MILNKKNLNYYQQNMITTYLIENKGDFIPFQF